MPDRAIPSSLNALDEDVYADDGGFPAASFLGEQLAHNDRALCANLRRGDCVAFDQADIPKIAAVCGLDLGAWPQVVAPWCRKGEWYFRGTIPDAEKVYFSGYMDGPNGYPVQRLPIGLLGPVTLTGVPAGSKVYGPFEVDILPGERRIGAALFTDVNSASPTSAACQFQTSKSITAVTGSFAVPAALAVPHYAIQLYDGDPTGAGLPITGWLQVTNALNPGGGASDTCYFWPPIDPNVSWELGNLYFEMRSTSYMDLESIMFREKPPTATEELSDYEPPAGVSSHGPAYIPVPDNMSFSGARFLSSPWWAQANNAQHMGTTRGRWVACDRYKDTELAAGEAQVGVFSFDATPLEDAYRVSLLFSMEIRQGGVAQFGYRVTSEDSAGGSVQNADAVQYIRPEFSGVGRPASRGTTLPMWWHETPGWQRVEVSTPWFTHFPDPALSLTQRVIRVLCSGDDYMSAGSNNFKLRGVSIVGFRKEPS